MGLLEALKLAKCKETRDCVLEEDSLVVIPWGRGNKCGSWRMNHYFLEIRSLIKELNVELHHVPRVQNFLVDELAKWSVGRDSLFDGDTLPDW